MKSILLLICLLLSGVIELRAQQITYEKLEDDPASIKTDYIAVEFMDAEFGGNRNANWIGLGANGNLALLNTVGVDFSARFKLIQDEAAPFGTVIEGGAFWQPGKGKVTTKEIKLRVGGSFGEKENRHVYSEKYIMVPAEIETKHGLRGGLYFNRGAYREQNFNGKPYIPYTLSGLYGGWVMTQRTGGTFKLKDTGSQKDLNTGPIYAKGYAKIYVDLLVTPVANRDFSVAPETEEDAQKANTSWGLRGGYLLYKDGPKWYNRFMFGSETGFRPVDGFYFRAIIGYEVFRG